MDVDIDVALLQGRYDLMTNCEFVGTRLTCTGMGRTTMVITGPTQLPNVSHFVFHKVLNVYNLRI